MKVQEEENKGPNRIVSACGLSTRLGGGLLRKFPGGQNLCLLICLEAAAAALSLPHKVRPDFLPNDHLN